MVLLRRRTGSTWAWHAFRVLTFLQLKSHARCVISPKIHRDTNPEEDILARLRWFQLYLLQRHLQALNRQQGSLNRDWNGSKFRCKPWRKVGVQNGEDQDLELERRDQFGSHWDRRSASFTRRQAHLVRALGHLLQECPSRTTRNVRPILQPHARSNQWDRQRPDQCRAWCVRFEESQCEARGHTDETQLSRARQLRYGS